MRHIGLKEASELTGLSISTLRRRVRSGQLYSIRACSSKGKILFNKSVLEIQLSNEAIGAAGFGDEDAVENSADETVSQPRREYSHLEGLFKEEGE